MDHKKTIVFNLAATGVLIAVFSGVAIFLRQDIKNRSAEYVAAKNEINSHSEAIKSLAGLKTDAEEAKKYEQQIAAYLISKDQLINFSKDINQMAQQNKIGVNVSFREEIPPTESEPRRTSLSMSSEGESTFFNFAKFLGFLENSKYSIKFLGLDASQEGAALKFNINSQVFSF